MDKQKNKESVFDSCWNWLGSSFYMLTLIFFEKLETGFSKFNEWLEWEAPIRDDLFYKLVIFAMFFLTTIILGVIYGCFSLPIVAFQGEAYLDIVEFSKITDRVLFFLVLFNLIALIIVIMSENNSARSVLSKILKKCIKIVLTPFVFLQKL